MIHVRFQAPVANYTGVVGGVRFVDGLGETDDPNVVAYFTRQGYTPVYEPQEGEPPAAFNPGEHTVEEVITYLNGLDPEDPERDRVLAAEAAGKARKGITGEQGE